MKKINIFIGTILTVLISFNISAQNFALKFDDNGYSMKNTVTVNDINVNGNTSISVEAWCNLESLSGNSTIVIKENPDCQSSADIPYWMYINDAGYLVFHIGNGTSFTQVASTSTIPFNEWHHLAGTWDGSTIRVYIDGIEEATGFQSGPFNAVVGDAEMNIGNRWYCFRHPYDGIIDEVRIWDDARTEPEINDNMNRELIVPESNPDLIAYYKFNNGSGTIAYDSGPNGYDGVLGGYDFPSGTTSAPEWVPSSAMGSDCFNVDLGDDQTVYFGYNPMACATITANVTDGTPPYTYLWSTGETSESIEVCPEENTTYSVTVTDATQCSVAADVNIEVLDVRCGWNNNRVLVCHTSFWFPGFQYTICVRNWIVPFLLYFGDQLGSCDWYKSATLLDEMPEFENIEDIRVFDQKFYEEYFKSDDLTELNQSELIIYPNPVSGTAKINFEVSKQVQTSVELINSLGQVVEQLYNGVSETNKIYSVEFNARNFNGGIYFVRLINGSEVIQQKVSIIK